MLVGIGELPQRFVGPAVKRKLVNHALEPVGRRGEGALGVIKHGGSELGVGQHFLDVAQFLLRLGRKLAIGELHQQLAAFVLGAQGMHGVAVGFLHLLVVDVADLVLGLGGFFHGGVEQDEVLVLGFGLGEAVGAALAKPAIGNGELGLGEVLAGVVGVDEGLQREPRDFEAAVLDIVDGLVKQDLVGLLGVFGDRVVVLVTFRARTRQNHQRDEQCDVTNGVSNHISIPYTFTPVAPAAIWRISRTAA